MDKDKMPEGLERPRRPRLPMREELESDRLEREEREARKLQRDYLRDLVSTPGWREVVLPLVEHLVRGAMITLVGDHPEAMDFGKICIAKGRVSALQELRDQITAEAGIVFPGEEGEKENGGSE